MEYRILVIILSFFLSDYAWGENGKFLIEGNVKLQGSKKVILLVRGNQRMDTLGYCLLENGKFRMTGEIRQTGVALLLVEGTTQRTVILLERNTDYRVDWPETGLPRIKGGKLQQQLSYYFRIVEKANREIVGLNTQYKKASEHMHMKTAGELKQKIENRKMTTQQKINELIGKNRGNLFAVYMLTSQMEQMGLEALQACYENLTGQEKKLEPALWVQERIIKLKNTEVGSLAPDFTLPDSSGGAISLYEVKGQLKILDFWASWCGPCRMENPNMVKLYQDFKEQGVEVVSVSLDTQKDKWTDAIRQDGMPWIHVSDLKGWKSDVVRQYGVDAMPFIIVLDENNRILAKQLRGEKLRVFVGRMLNP